MLRRLLINLHPLHLYLVQFKRRRKRFVYSMPASRGRLTIFAPDLTTDGYYGGTRYGLENESARLNLNTILLADKSGGDENGGRKLLMALPGMTESIADAILGGWRVTGQFSAYTGTPFTVSGSSQSIRCAGTGGAFFCSTRRWSIWPATVSRTT